MARRKNQYGPCPTEAAAAEVEVTGGWTLLPLEDGSGKFTFTCHNPRCQMPHLIIGSKGYVREKADAHIEWCGKRPAPMSWR